jgi:hypothetical protein
MIRAALLLAIGCAHGACSPAEPTANSIAADTRAAAPNADRGTVSTMSELKIVISSDAERVTAKLDDNEATRALMRMLPLTIDMRDHLRQEKTGNLPSPLPEVPRQTDFSVGTLGLWGNDDFVIYYRSGRVPQPGIIALGRASGDVSGFDRPGPVTVRIERSDAVSTE